jgi:hypothetical protein
MSWRIFFMARFHLPTTINYYAEGDASLTDVLRGLDKNVDGGNVVIESEFDIKEISFGYASSTPATIATVREGERVKRVAIQIVSSFDDSASTLSVGHAGNQNALLTVDQNDPTEIGMYEVSPEFKYFGADTIKLYINRAGATTGSGVVFLWTERNDIN